MSLLVLRSANGQLATKRHTRDAKGIITTEDYGLEKWWFAEERHFNDFPSLVSALSALLDEPTTLGVRGTLKAGIDTTSRIVRQSNGPDATIEDVPRHVLHLDIDNVDESHLDIVNCPEEARQYVRGLIAKAAPELEGAACWMSWSSSAGVFDRTRVKVHIWYWLAEPYTCAQLKVWGKQVNARAGFKLVDLALFQSVQPNYTARPLFKGMDDPFPGAARAAVVDGHAPTLVIEKPPPRPARSGTNIIGGRGGSSSPRIEAIVATMGDGVGKYGFHQPWNSALATFYAQNGPDADPRPLIAKLVRTIRRHGTRDEKYITAETLGMIRRARVLAAKERAQRDGMKTLRSVLSFHIKEGNTDYE